MDKPIAFFFTQFTDVTTILEEQSKEILGEPTKKKTTTKRKKKEEIKGSGLIG